MSDFDFDSHYRDAPGWICNLCGEFFPGDVKILEEHYHECKDNYITKRQQELEEQAMDEYLQGQGITWSEFIREMLGDDAGNKYDQYDDDKIPEEE